MSKINFPSANGSGRNIRRIHILRRIILPPAHHLTAFLEITTTTWKVLGVNFHICHGAPSPLLYKGYLPSEAPQHGNSRVFKG